MLTLTDELIEKGKTERGGYTYAQMLVLGCSVPFRKGWKRKIIGTTISEEDYQRFLDARYMRQPKKRKRRFR